MYLFPYNTVNRVSGNGHVMILFLFCLVFLTVITSIYIYMCGDKFEDIEHKSIVKQENDYCLEVNSVSLYVLI